MTPAHAHNVESCLSARCQAASCSDFSAATGMDSLRSVRRRIARMAVLVWYVEMPIGTERLMAPGRGPMVCGGDHVPT